MENLRNLSQTEQLSQCVSIIKEKSLDLLKQKNANEDFINDQIEIYKKVDDYVASLGNLDNISVDEFYKYLLKTCAMFNNAHLGVRYKKECEDLKFLSTHLLHLNGKVYALCDEKFFEVEKIGGKSVEEICKSMSEYICYETKEWLSVQLCNYLNRSTLYDILNIDYTIIELKNGKKLNVSKTEEFNGSSQFFPPYDLPHKKLFNYFVIEPKYRKDITEQT